MIVYFHWDLEIIHCTIVVKVLYKGAKEVQSTCSIVYLMGY